MEIIQKRFYRKSYPLPKNKQAALRRRLVCVVGYRFFLFPKRSEWVPVFTMISTSS